MPAEWSRHRGTWLAWPHNETDWPGHFERIPEVFTEIIRHLSEIERVRLLVRTTEEQARVGALLESAGARSSAVDFYVSGTNRSWTRDYLPTFVVGPDGLGAVKWHFNAWSRYDDFEYDDLAGARVAEWLGVPSWSPRAGADDRRFVMEGGALDVDGEGTVLVCEECLLTGPHARNPMLDRAQTERVFGDHLGATTVLWLTTGIAGDDTAGHVDDFARFVGPGRIVLCRVEDSRDVNYGPLMENHERLQGARDASGRTIEVIALPMPRPIRIDGQRLPASYANFYIANERVLVPTFDDARDGNALGILSELFPDRVVVGVRCDDLVLGLGSIHCSTQQEPDPDTA
jgi:agmatine deiminase